MLYQEDQTMRLFADTSRNNRFDSLSEIKDIAVECERCNLRQGCKQVVFGTGNEDAGLLFVGEGPGAEEDRKGEPFVGNAGKLLDKILAAAEIAREEVYISNVIKCRPPNNRTPSKKEMKTCLWILAQEIELIDPTIIVPLGSTALKGLLAPNGSITRMRGNWIERKGYYFLPTFHPAALLHDERKKADLWRDFLKIKKAYQKYLRLKKEGKEV